MKGYMTIEASLLMPMLLCSIIFTMYTGMYLYDNCVIQQSAYIAALRGANQTREGDDKIKQVTEEALSKVLGKRLVMIPGIQKEIQINRSSVTVTITATMEMPFSSFLTEELKLWQIQKKGTANRLDPVKNIRDMRRFL